MPSKRFTYKIDSKICIDIKNIRLNPILGDIYCVSAETPSKSLESQKSRAIPSQTHLSLPHNARQPAFQFTWTQLLSFHLLHIQFHGKFNIQLN